MNTLRDIIGIGFGPANIALAIAIEELYPDLNILFLESKPSTQWHTDAMYGGTDIQNHPLRDFVTPRNPKSHYTFVNFLKETNRLFEHLNLGVTFPLRTEYSQYIQWVAKHFDDSVQYQQEVIDIDTLMDENGQQKGYKVTTKSGQVFHTKSVVVAPGRSPYTPPILDDLNSQRAIHFTKTVSTLKQLDQQSTRLKNIAVVGGSQSAVELILELRKRYPEAKIYSLMRHYGFRQKDLSPFMGEVYFPEYSDYYFHSNAQSKQELDKDLRYTNYSSADKDIIDQLYLDMYEDKITGKNRVELLNNCDIQSARIENDQVVVELTERYRNKNQTIRADLLISATGFRDTGSGENQEPIHPILNKLAPYLDTDEKQCVVMHRNYSVRVKDSISKKCPLVLNGLCEKSHGMGDAGSFSLLALRSEEILNYIVQSIAEIPAEYKQLSEAI